MTRPSYQIAAYFPEWEVRRPYYVKDIVAAGSAEKITILNYAFGVPGPDESGTVVCQFLDAQPAYVQPYTAEMSVDGEADQPGQALRGHFQQLRKLKVRFPHIRVVVSLGAGRNRPGSRSRRGRRNRAGILSARASMCIFAVICR